MNAANHSLRCVRRKEDPLAAATEVFASGLTLPEGDKQNQTLNWDNLNKKWTAGPPLLMDESE